MQANVERNPSAALFNTLGDTTPLTFCVIIGDGIGIAGGRGFCGGEGTSCNQIAGTTCATGYGHRWCKRRYRATGAEPHGACTGNGAAAASNVSPSGEVVQGAAGRVQGNVPVDRIGPRRAETSIPCVQSRSAMEGTQKRSLKPRLGTVGFQARLFPNPTGLLLTVDCKTKHPNRSCNAVPITTGSVCELLPSTHGQ